MQLDESLHNPYNILESEVKAMDEIVNLILNSSVTIVVIAYFIFRDWKFNEKLTSALTSLNETVNMLKELIMKGDK